MDDDKLAREIGVECPNCDNSGVTMHEYSRGPEPEQCQFCYQHPGSVFQIKALIARVRADEREACAKVCEGVYGGRRAHTYASENADRYIAQDETITACAAAIRNRRVE